MILRYVKRARGARNLFKPSSGDRTHSKFISALRDVYLKSSGSVDEGRFTAEGRPCIAGIRLWFKENDELPLRELLQAENPPGDLVSADRPQRDFYRMGLNIRRIINLDLCVQVIQSASTVCPRLRPNEVPATLDSHESKAAVLVSPPHQRGLARMSLLRLIFGGVGRCDRNSNILERLPECIRHAAEQLACVCRRRERGQRHPQQQHSHAVAFYARRGTPGSVCEAATRFGRRGNLSQSCSILQVRRTIRVRGSIWAAKTSDIRRSLPSHPEGDRREASGCRVKTLAGCESAPPATPSFFVAPRR